MRREESQRTLVIIDRLAGKEEGSQRTLVIIDRLAGRREGSMRTLVIIDRLPGRREGHTGLWSLLVAWWGGERVTEDSGHY